MTAAELLAAREPEWLELERLISEHETPRVLSSQSGETISRLASLYRSASSDLALAESYQLPPSTIERLNELVGRAHNALYRRQRAEGRSFWRLAFLETPRWLLCDGAFWLAAALFWIPYATCFMASYADRSFAESVVGKGSLDRFVAMYSEPMEPDFVDRLPMVAFYAHHNGSIAFKMFAYSLLGCFPGLFILLSNASVLGCVSGFMLSPACPSAASMNFFEFTRAHGPFELTGVVLASAAGLRIGFSLISTKGYSRLDAMRRATIKATPCLIVAFVLICLAGSIEAFVSPMPSSNFKWFFGGRSLAFKLMIEWASIVALVCYIFGFGLASLRRRYGKGFLVASLRRALRRFFERTSFDAVPFESYATDPRNRAPTPLVDSPSEDAYERSSRP